MTELDLDHVVVFCSVDAPEAKALEAVGLQGFGGTTKQGKLGTASTSFFFSNLRYIELFWIHDLQAARQHLEPLSLNAEARMNWRESEVSPFGLMLRRKQPDSTDLAPFPAKQMEADWMPPGTFVDFNGETVTEPYYGLVPEALSFRGFRANIEDLPHPLGVHHLTSVTFHLPTAARSPIAQLVEANGVASFVTDTEHFAVFRFDDGTQNKSVDLRPTLPMLLNY
jgi:hypothetical protein